MTWAGTAVVWTVAGGVPRSLGLVGETNAEAAGFTFVQIRDSHIGFKRPVNPNVIGTLEEAINKIKALPERPSFMIHTGDISHLAKVSEFDDAERVIWHAHLDVHYVPGEHDVVADGGKLYKERFGRGTRGAGWYAFDANGVHFVGLVNVVNLKAGGLGNLGADQLAWLASDLKGRTDSTPIVVFAHVPLWVVYPPWGWGTEDGERVLGMLKRFGPCSTVTSTRSSRRSRAMSPSTPRARLPSRSRRGDRCPRPFRCRSMTTSCAACSALPASTSCPASSGSPSWIRRCRAEPITSPPSAASGGSGRRSDGFLLELPGLNQFGRHGNKSCTVPI
jgi:hypothetical protein